MIPLKKTRYPGIYERSGYKSRPAVRYVLVSSYKNGEGKYDQKWSTHTTQAAALAAQREFKNRLDQGVKPRPGKATLAEFVTKTWLPEVEATRRPLTFQQYTLVTRKHIVPGLGGLKLKDVSRDQLREFYRALPTDATRSTVSAVLSSAMSYAVAEGLLAANPCASYRPKPHRAPETKHLDHDEVIRMLDVAKGHALEGPVVLGLAGGLRISEVLALRWKDINFITGKITVGSSYWGETKNGETRSFMLPASALAALRRVKSQQAESLLAVGIRQDVSTLVFANALGGQVGPRWLAERFHRFVVEHGFGVTFHGLRHSCAIALLTAGVDVKTAASRLGHSPAVLLATYAHFVASADEAAAERLDGALQ